MRYTFMHDDGMVINIALGSIQNAGPGELMPDHFTCRFKDVYKVFLQGRPNVLGAAQLVTAVLIICLGSTFIVWAEKGYIIIPSVMFIPCGILTFASGRTPFMPLMKLSFVFNIICLFTAVGLAILCAIIDSLNPSTNVLHVGLLAVMAVLYGLEFVLASIIIYFESQAVCRTHFNTLPMISLKQDM